MAHTILRKNELTNKIKISRSHIENRLNPKSPYYDPTFPRPIKLGNGARSVGFLESDVDRWIEQQIRLSHASSNQE
uniref:Transcriptional regulator, AlpA family n=1 Tax=Candidatus Kentrum sp. TUN TaxID=2126343 RepID=A0A450ZK74_9GAMM|nr:MAG: transcriptional regulator, AlpA family [Candidatus Kentron sp. TUN]